MQADIVSYDTRERELASSYLPRLKADELAFYDRRYPAFRSLAYHHEEIWHCCMRVHKDFRAKVLALNLAMLFATAAQRLMDDRHRQRRRAYRVNFANALSKRKNNNARIFLYTSPGELCWRLMQKMASSRGGHTARPLLSAEIKGSDSTGILSKLQAISVRYGLS